MAEPHVVVLGGGPAGVGAAYRLRRDGKARVSVLEQQSVVGGNAGSFEIGGLRVDYGSHRLHCAVAPEILADLRRLLAGDLRSRERHGRIRLRGRWLHFPLRATDLLFQLDRGFAVAAAMDMLRRALPGRRVEGDSFASVLLSNLGPTISRHFYFPYARKIWGCEPEELSGIQARKRVSAGSFSRLLRRLVQPPGGGRFFYPRHGYGQITEALAGAAAQLGANLRLGWRVERLRRPTAQGRPWIVEAVRSGERLELAADYVWSTLPVSVLVRMVDPAPPDAVLSAAGEMRFRAMVLVYLELDVEQFTSTDAHYFPEQNVCFTRVSEPKNYFGASEPAGRTVLCAELPCEIGDAWWSSTDDELAALVAGDLAVSGLALPRPPISVLTRRLTHAYPIYPLGYEHSHAALDSWCSGLSNLLTYGRQGLFAHDNTHHALAMAYAAVDCFADGVFDSRAWARHREIFATHVVED